jgi:uncharacterized protein (DUF433 family)
MFKLTEIKQFATSTGLAGIYIPLLKEDPIMDDKKMLDRIILNPKIMVGKPVIRGTRLTVDFILNLLAHGTTENEILNEYKGITIEDIRACFLFATKSLGNTDFIPMMEEPA